MRVLFPLPRHPRPAFQALALTVIAAAISFIPDTAARAQALANEVAMTVEPDPAPSAEGFAAWKDGFRTRAVAAGVDPATLDTALKGAAFDAKVLERDRNQNEFTKTIWDYLDTAVSDDRIAHGKKAMVKQAAMLDRIEAEYRVDRHVVAAIWGLESAYGSFKGSNSTISSLATLAYDSRRAAFFEAELIEALKILGNGDIGLAGMTGSWAGAMGHTQFMPSSWAKFAVDFDKDGKRDIWGDDPTDALASAANYLKFWGWREGLPWGAEISLPQGFDYGETTEVIRKPLKDWQALGISLADGRSIDSLAAPDELASVLLPGGARGAAFLIFANFQVIERYNTADAYVIAVGHLADRLRGGPALKADWPRELRALTLEERKDLQARLAAAGFDPLGVDGRIGPRTIAAVKAWQKANGKLTDGYASLEVLSALPPLPAKTQ